VSVTLQDDPNIKLPRSVREAAAKADQMFHSFRDFPVNEPTKEGTDITPQVTQEGNPELDASTLTAEVQNPAPVTQEVTQLPAEEDKTWEHKYKSLHGRYIQSQEHNRSMSEQISNLQGVIATMQATAAAAPQIPEFKLESQLTPEEVSDYGEDLLKVVGKKAREEFAPIAKAYEAKIAQLESRLEGFSGFVQQDSHQKLMATLDSQLPNWRETNTNQQFLDWLSLPDPYSGAIRRDMLKAAYAQGNAPRVLAFFNGFLAEEAAVDPVAIVPDPKATIVEKVPLEKFAAPGRAKTAASNSAPAEKPIFTRAQIATFYADIAQGKYRGRDELKNKAEAEIFSAQREGRIR
jgi:hypothetical protein